MTNPLTAPPITKAMLKLARQIDSSGVPDYVAVKPEEECLPERCHENVTAMVRRHGGSVQHGWILREQATAFVEGSFHAVWRRPDGRLIDITPRTDQQSRILFLPDSKTVWEGQVIEPRRLMLHEQSCYCGSGMPFKICHGQADE